MRGHEKKDKVKVALYSINYLCCQMGYTVPYDMLAYRSGNTGTRTCHMEPYHPSDNVDNKFVASLNLQEKIITIFPVSILTMLAVINL